MRVEVEIAEVRDVDSDDVRAALYVGMPIQIVAVVGRADCLRRDRGGHRTHT